MEMKYQTTKTSKRQMAAHSLSPKLEERESGDEKTSSHNNYAATLSRDTHVTSLPPALTKDRKYPSLESVNFSSSKISVRKELVSNETFSRKFEPLKPSCSAETQNSDIYLQKRPIKLAPLNLPEEVKEAQLKKMKDEVYLAQKSYKKMDKMMKALNHRPIKRETLNKLGMAEEHLEEVKVENMLPTDSKGLEDDKPNIVPLSGKSQERRSNSSAIKIKGGHVHNSVPKIITLDATDVSVKGRFNNTKSDSRNHSVPKAVKVNRLGIAEEGQK